MQQTQSDYIAHIFFPSLYRDSISSNHLIKKEEIRVFSSWLHNPSIISHIERNSLYLLLEKRDENAYLSKLLFGDSNKKYSRALEIYLCVLKNEVKKELQSVAFVNF